MNRPIRKVSIALGLLFLALFVNLNVVQVIKGSSYRNDSQNRRVLLNEYSSPRGQIVVDGNAVAESRATKDELKYLRVYPQGPIYAPATGFYSFTYGADGIEAIENPILSGDSSQLFTSKFADILTGRNPRGGSVDLTLNHAAQVAAYNAMKSGNGSFKRGAVVALDPRTGAILALVSTPSYDPNRLSSHDSASISRAYKEFQNAKSQPMLDRALNQNYPAGSIFKIIDSAAALRHGVTADQRIPAANSFWPLDPTRKSSCPASLSAPCVENFGGEQCDNGQTATLAFALAKSCNTAFAALAVTKIGAGDLKKQAQLFGFDGPQLKVPLSVAPSTVGSDQTLSDDAALAQTSFGQRDVRITPIQAAMLSAAVANDGTLMQPYLVSTERRPNLSVLNTTKQKQLSQVLDPTLDQELIKMMEGVVTSREGTGGPANITDLGPTVQVGGKTGTADVGATSASRIPPDAWFTGFALVKGSPRIAVAVVI
ncbi:MAG TPA: penicillin-binding transpeptidase domain-containing protein, partial [Jatrophihabitantaceae bacterium]|nr:penicillin-binding transpeptidase domain-containing protein [Jatrophihabitantaceae bacterium]